MPMIDDLRVSKFLKKADLGEDEEAIFTIKSVGEDNVGTEDSEDIKSVLHFKETTKPMVLNWTNMQLIANAVGSRNTDDWTGKKVCVWFDPSVQFKGEMKGGLRIRKIKGVKEAPAREPGEDDVPWPE